MGPIEDAPPDAPNRAEELQAKYKGMRCPACGYQWPDVTFRECPRCRSSNIVYIPHEAEPGSEAGELSGMTELERRVQPVVERLVLNGWIEPEQQPQTITELSTHEEKRAFRLVWQEDGGRREEVSSSARFHLCRGSA